MVEAFQRELIIENWKSREQKTIEVGDRLTGPAKALARVALILSNKKPNGVAQKVNEIEASIGLNGGKYLYGVDVFPSFFENAHDGVLALMVHDESEDRPKVQIALAMGIVRDELVLAALHKPGLPIVSYKKIKKRSDVLSTDSVYGSFRELGTEIISFLSNKEEYSIDSSGSVYMNFVDILMT